MDIINLITWCGLRTEEVLALWWEDIDFDNKRINVKRAEVKVAGKGRVAKETKTRSSMRKVIIPDKVLDILRKWKEYCEASFQTWTRQRPDLVKVQKYVLVKQEDGSLPYPDSFSHWLRKYRLKYNFERVTPHGLRHFYTTYLLVKGVDIKTVSRLLGHSKTATTLNIYASICREGFEKAESILNEE
ncbi:MAG: site-specific integrase [Acidaminococcaceae bacterium]|nr:site-specific integrase [Acidaminococcaceae bacterium]